MKTLRALAVSQNKDLFLEYCQLRQGLIMDAEEKYTWQIRNDTSCIFEVGDGIKSTEFKNTFCIRSVKILFLCLTFFFEFV